MVRPADRRTAKYDVKTSAPEVAKRFEGLKPMMVEQVGNIFSKLTHFESKAKVILDGAGIKVHQIPFYLSYLREVYRVLITHGGKTAEDEAKTLKAKWVDRGLDTIILERLAREVLGIEAT